MNFGSLLAAVSQPENVLESIIMQICHLRIEASSRFGTHRRAGHCHSDIRLQPFRLRKKFVVCAPVSGQSLLTDYPGARNQQIKCNEF